MGKSRKNIRTGKKNRKTIRRGKNANRKYSSKNKKGGSCYGTGVGANSYDPNFSIFNTRELQLFPYKP
jgi:hypothetical protein